MAILDTLRKFEKTKDSLPAEKVDTPTRKEAMLMSAMNERRVLEVVVDERTQIFSSSSILEISAFRGRPSLVIDTLIPKLEGIHALEGSEKLRLGFRINGVPHTFITKLLSLSEETSPIVTIAYPKTIYIHQFRSAYRHLPGMADPIAASVEFTAVRIREEMEDEAGDEGSKKKENFQETGNPVVDISISGMAFLTKNANLTKDTDVFVEFAIPGVGEFKTMATVKNLFRTESFKFPFKCGLLFGDLTKADQERINRYIIAMQREALKKRQGRE